MRREKSEGATASGRWSNERMKFLNLDRVEVDDNFNGEGSSVDEIAEEEVVCCLRVTTNFEDLHKVVELPTKGGRSFETREVVCGDDGGTECIPMNVTHDRKRILECDEVWLVAWERWKIVS